ncbi:MAG TPA: FKBP-type peptidyl-prolyl cis-trans isomerase [Planctomycetota bacterium]|nr:FKBP-type peptidyl-prolyl cis-trans isomerase [Planctomycetota bacterium]
MHRHRLLSLLSLTLLGPLGACHKDKPAAPPAAPAKTTEEISAPLDGGVAISPTPAKPEAPASSEVAPAEGAPVEGAAAPADASKTPTEVAAAPAAGEPEVKPPAGESTGEVAAAKSEDKPATTEEPAADAKKSKKKSGDKAAVEKAAEVPAKPKFTELGITVTKTGTGVAATSGRRVMIHYKASVADAEKPFDSTFASNRPLDVELGSGAKLKVIEGLRLGLEGLMPGSEVRLQIPANLAWGEKGNPAVGVPANADVVFEVQVLDVQ